MNWEQDPDEFRQTKIAFAIGAGLGLLVVAWLWLARPADESVVSGGGFNMGGAAGGAIPFDRKGQTGLSYVRLGSAVGDDAAAAPATARAPGADPVSADGGPALSDIGAPSDREGLRRLGAERGLLSRLVAGALNHPAALAVLLNNKTLVDAYFSRGQVQQNCASGASLKSYLMNGADPQGVAEETAIARNLLQNRQAAAAAAGTEFGARLLACPAVGQLAADRSSAVQIAAANPSLMGLVGDPAAASALASNPRAAALLGGVQAALSAAPAPAAP